MRNDDAVYRDARVTRIHVSLNIRQLILSRCLQMIATFGRRFGLVVRRGDLTMKARFFCAIHSCSPLYGLAAINEHAQSLHVALSKYKGDPRAQIKTIRAIEHFERVAGEMIEARKACRISAGEVLDTAADRPLS